MSRPENILFLTVILCTLSLLGLCYYVMTAAVKRTLIFNPPAILTVHLKRFEQVFQTFHVASICDR